MRFLLGRGRGVVGPSYLMPEFLAAGAGATHVTSAFAIHSIPLPAGITTDDVVFLHVVSRDLNALPANISGWVTRGVATFNTNRQVAVYSRVINGTEGSSVSVPLSANPNSACARTYAYRGAALTSTPAGKFAVIANSSTAASSSNAISMPSITTSVANSIAMTFIGVDEAPTLAASTGESGGDWVEATAEYVTTVGNNSGIQLQTADLASATTISGGSTGLGGSNDGARVSFSMQGTSGVPTFVAAGAGTDFSSVASLTLALPAGIAEGDMLVAHVGSRTTGQAPDTIPGWTPVGTDNSGGRDNNVFLRIASASESDLVLTLPAVTDVAVGRMYAFTNCAGVADLEDSQHTASSGSVLTGPTLGPTDQPNELGVSFVYNDDDEATGAYSGASGGTWAEAVAEYTTATGNDSTLQCQIVEIPSAGTTVSGGTITTTADEMQARSFCFRGVLE